MSLEVETNDRLKTLPTLSAPSPETTTRPSPAGSKHLAGLDGVRGAACLLVLYGHTWVHMNSPVWQSWRVFGHVMSPWHLFSYGYGGVPIFFILSGFCLSYPIFSKPSQPVDWKRYFVNRVRRIVPPYWAALLLLCAVSLFILHRHLEPFLSAGTVPWPGWKQVGYSMLLVSTAFNSSFWTLPLEWRWYFVLPVFIILWRRIRGLGLLCLTLPISAFSLYALPKMHLAKADFLIGTLPSYLPLFALGIYAAQLIACRDNRQWEHVLIRYSGWGLAASILAVVIAGPLWPYKGSAIVTVLTELVWGPVGFFAVLGAVQPNSVVNRIASTRGLVSVGVFSYSLYLIHEPFVRAACTLVLERRLGMAVEIAAQLIVPTALIAVGYLFFLVAEKPFLRKSSR